MITDLSGDRWWKWR